MPLEQNFCTLLVSVWLHVLWIKLIVKNVPAQSLCICHLCNKHALIAWKKLVVKNVPAQSLCNWHLHVCQQA